MASPSVGVFTDTAGLSYQTGTLTGTTGPEGQFKYNQGEAVTFSVGSLQLGTAKGKSRLNILDLVDNPSLTNTKLINRARLLFSLTPGLGFEKAIQIDDRVCHKTHTCKTFGVQSLIISLARFEISSQGIIKNLTLIPITRVPRDQF